MISLLPEQKYTPSEEEMTRASTTGEKIFDYRQTEKESANGTITFIQKFFIPYEALPHQLVNSLQRSNSTSSFAPALYHHPLSDSPRIIFSHHYSPSPPPPPLYYNGAIVPTSHGDSMFGVVFELGEIFHGVFDVYEAVKWSYDLADGLELLDEMQSEVENCINNPPNPLITRESQEYLLQKIRDAKTDLNLNTVMRFIGAMGGLYVPYAFPVLSKANHNLDEVDKYNIGFLQRNVIKCDETPPPPIPPSYAPQEFKGTIEYYVHDHSGHEDCPGNFNCVSRFDEIQSVKGEFTITIIQDRTMTGRGSAHFIHTRDAEYEPLSPAEWNYSVDKYETSSGDYPIFVTVRMFGVPLGSVVVDVESDPDSGTMRFPRHEVHHWMQCKSDGTCTPQTDESSGPTGADGIWCSFFPVHPTLGGTYLMPYITPSGFDKYCRLTLTPLQ
jgi:hypothetical protein